MLLSRLPWLVLSVAAFFVGRRVERYNTSAATQPLTDVDPSVRSHLYEPPPMHGSVAVPSVVRDARGAVHNLRIGGFRFNVLVSKAGTLRSGDVHRSAQYEYGRSAPTLDEPVKAAHPVCLRPCGQHDLLRRGARHNIRRWSRCRTGVQRRSTDHHSSARATHISFRERHGHGRMVGRRLRGALLHAVPQAGGRGTAQGH